MTRILLIQPVHHEAAESKSPPLGLAYLGAIAEGKGCQVKILDAVSFYRRLSYDEIVREARSFQPHCIGLTLRTYFVARSYQLVKELLPLGALMVAGGSHASLMPEEVLGQGIEVVVRGEGENSFNEIIDYLRGEKDLKDILGISYKKNGEVSHNQSRPPSENLDKLPFPAKHLFRLDDYCRKEGEAKRYFGSIMASRGCVGHCTYCSTRGVWGLRYRYRSPENILAEMLSLKERYGVDFFSFEDDVLTVNKPVVSRLCDLLAAHFPEVRWTAITRPDCVDQQLLGRMREAGCIAISYGVESGNPRTLQRIKKGFTLATVEKVIGETLKAGIPIVRLNFMWGFPWEDAEDIRYSVSTVRRFMQLSSNIDIMSGGVLIPFPGTEIYEEFKEQYDFEGWWLRTREFNYHFRQNEIIPFYQRAFFGDHGQLIGKNSSFFPHRPEVRRALKEAEELIGRQVLEKGTAEKFRGKLRRRLFLSVILLCVRLSSFFYRLSPKLEVVLFWPERKLVGRR